MMNKIEEYLNSFFQKYPADLYLIAVSGGVDSMLLLKLMQEQRLPIHVLHVNYNLRGTDSVADEKLVRKFCQTNKIPFTIKSLDFKSILKNEGGNLQNEARKVRYNFFQSKLVKFQNATIVLAHHSDDQLETFYLQLFRNSGIAGLAGMKEQNNTYLRPLLPFKKAELYQFAQELKIDWREDKSNAKNQYSRNRLRNELIPFLKKEIPTLENSIQLIQEIFLEKLIETNLLIEKIQIEIQRSNELKIETWKRLESIEKIELLKKLKIPTFLFDAVNQLEFLQKGTKVQWEHAENQYEIIREKDYFYFSSIQNPTKIPTFEMRKVQNLPTSFSKSIIYLDETKVKGAISIRKWKIGDRIYPIGLEGSKLISDVLTSGQVSNNARKNQYVLIDEEKILACLNFVIDRRAIATSSTKNIVKIKFT